VNGAGGQQVETTYLAVLIAAFVAIAAVSVYFVMRLLSRGE
jgi:hypothetical protein